MICPVVYFLLVYCISGDTVLCQQAENNESCTPSASANCPMSEDAECKECSNQDSMSPKHRRGKKYLAGEKYHASSPGNKVTQLRLMFPNHSCM